MTLPVTPKDMFKRAVVGSSIMAKLTGATGHEGRHSAEHVERRGADGYNDTDWPDIILCLEMLLQAVLSSGPAVSSKVEAVHQDGIRLLRACMRD
jgi:hypothetical protein